MKKSILTFALTLGMGFAFAPPLTIPAMADPHYEVGGEGAILWQHSFARGNQRCRVVSQNRVVRDWGENWDRWIYVKVTKANTRYYRPWEASPSAVGCHGWIDKKYLHSITSNGRRVTDRAWYEIYPHISKGGRWGNEVPVFTSRDAYFSARTSMNRNGHYNGQSGSVACKLKVGTYLDSFEPFKNWGVGEVYNKDEDTGVECRGWMDRALVIPGNF